MAENDQPRFSDGDDRCNIWAEHPWDERCHLAAPHPGFRHRRKSDPTFQWDDKGHVRSASTSSRTNVFDIVRGEPPALIPPQAVSVLETAKNAHHPSVTSSDGLPQSNLVDHAKRELTALGEDQETIDWYLKVIRSFADYGHSGESASVTIAVINDLLRFKNLMPLTDDPKEWVHHGEEVWGEEGGVWQNIRNGEAFSNDGGKTYYLLSEGGNDQNREPRHMSVSKEVFNRQNRE